MKKILSIISIVIFSVLLVSCGQKDNKITKENISATLICPDGLPAIAISNLISDESNDEEITINCSIEKTTDTLLSELMKGESDLAIVPSNLALQAYKKDLGYKIAGTIGWGSLYLVSTEEVDSLLDLEGCEIYNTGKGLTPDIVFKDILQNNNVNENNITFSYVGAASELAPLVMSGQAKYAVLPEPVLSTVMAKNENIKIICNLNDEWKKVHDVENGYPQSTLLIKEEFYNTIKDSGLYDEIINKFIESEDWAINNPELAAEQCEKLEENKKNATQDFKECVAVADYYKAAFYKNVYAVGKDSQKLSQMEQNMEDAQKRMGEMSPIKVKIDRMLEEYMVANN